MYKRLVWVVAVVALLGFVGMAGAEGKVSLVNINTADEAALLTLDNIGKSRAQAIIQYREANGPFQSVEQLKNVQGIGQKVFETIKDKITVGST